MEKKSLGQINFEAYKEAKQGATYDSKPIPEWNDLDDAVRNGWEAGAKAVLREIVVSRIEEMFKD